MISRSRRLKLAPLVADSPEVDLAMPIFWHRRRALSIAPPARSHLFHAILLRGFGELGGGFETSRGGLPLLNFPVETRRDLIEAALARLAPGAPYIQFSYGTKPSIPPTERYTVKRAAVIWKNLPPARVWVYRSI